METMRSKSLHTDALFTTIENKAAGSENRDEEFRQCDGWRRRLAEKAGTYVQLIAKCVQFFHWTVE
jgi:hypothetical protein